MKVDIDWLFAAFLSFLIDNYWNQYRHVEELALISYSEYGAV